MLVGISYEKDTVKNKHRHSCLIEEYKLGQGRITNWILPCPINPVKGYKSSALSSLADFTDNSPGAISNTVLAPRSPAFASRYAALA